ncbi:hypothetical protein LO763_08470 [Glycomyces sp. A-F 0318]|uniref:hypothetical protein n=1 Tax=Glycomyces amatae TaxID=2881355 RepID=UPI001E323294|nr:hypothetical protein [Glycomyces amatae]MCD0443657.1 hypothetical protein [Glycomyces amatae]
MPKPIFSEDDFENPDAPEGERRIKSSHWEVRDLSYDVSRLRKRIDLMKGALFWMEVDPLEAYPGPEDLPDDAIAGPALELFVKERSRGTGYVADFLYRSEDLPVTVYGILANFGFGLEVCELEIWRERWGHWDSYGCFIDDPEEQAQIQREKDRHESKEPGTSRRVGITSDVLRRIPIGEIIAKAQHGLADRSWEIEGIKVLMGPDHEPGKVPEHTARALTSANELAKLPQRGRPRIDDALLKAVAEAYLRELPSGRGLTRRLANYFDRPEPTIKDWIRAARSRGYLPETHLLTGR